MQEPLENTYPNIADWVDSRGWLAIGPNEESNSFIRAFDDDSSLVWQGAESYDSLEEALQALDEALADLEE